MGRFSSGKKNPSRMLKKPRQLRSRIVQTLNVPQGRVRLGPSLTAALLDELFEHPARCTPVLPDIYSGVSAEFFRGLLARQ
jgi:hypothetical protein